MSIETGVLDVYVPVAGSALEQAIAPRSAIVGSEVAGSDRVRIDYEGNLYGAESMVRYEDKLLHAASRHVTRYPTVARRVVEADQLLRVGSYSYPQRRLDVDDGEALESWLS